MNPPDDRNVPCSPGIKILVESKEFQLGQLALNEGAIEYRVRRNPSKPTPTEDVVLMVAVAFFSKCVVDLYNGTWRWAFTQTVFLLIALVTLWLRLTNIQHEAVLAFPSIGIQLETYRGLSLFGDFLITTSVSRTFIPISAISDVIINEGLCGWNVRRYLVVLSAGETRLQVLFQALDPPFAVIEEVYHGLREMLFDDKNEEGASSSSSSKK